MCLKIHSEDEQVKNGIKMSLIKCVSLNQAQYSTSKQKADEVKAEMVDYAREKWPMFFSRFFKVIKLSGKHILFVYGCQCFVF